MEPIKDEVSPFAVSIDTLATEKEESVFKFDELSKQPEQPVVKGRKLKIESKRRKQLLGAENKFATPAEKAPIVEVEHDYDKEYEEMNNRLQNAKLQSSEKKPEQF